MKIGVIAGTPVDTQMGVDYIVSKGHEAVGFACSKSASEQNEMQILHKEELLKIAIEGCLDMVKQGAQGIFVNCNSLSGAIDMDTLKKEVPVCVVTPLDIYRICAEKYQRLAVMAANGQSLSAIERTILGANPECSVFGAGILPLVIAIETEKTSEEIYQELAIRKLTECFEAIGCDALILGCTHFPYIEKEVRENIGVEVINPSDQMLDILKSSR
ncbi:MAG: aspartate/glutamate racemase family protein [Anaerotignum sp.]|nr:aspartate/glutamate racemase family protein [Anaerotignum sp.]MBR6542622.1 aspartate/glutamate racemase family protein [Anaerotignum sp.]